MKLRGRRICQCADKVSTWQKYAKTGHEDGGFVRKQQKRAASATWFHCDVIKLINNSSCFSKIERKFRYSSQKFTISGELHTAPSPMRHLLLSLFLVGSLQAEVALVTNSSNKVVRVSAT